MALLQNEDFAIWYLRTSYLANVKDGIGERLINVNSSILNTPGFRAAGWNNEAIQRTYSPPIPTTGTSEYFQNGGLVQRDFSHGEEEDEGGMVTGRNSNDTVGPGPNVRRRRRKEHVDDDDSSELSDETDDDTADGQRATQQIKFAKMPARTRAESSPTRNSFTPNGPDVTITSPSKPTLDGRRRTGSLGAVEAVKARARADTVTSSDMSSENEVDPIYFQRRQVNVNNSSEANPLSNALANEVHNVPRGEQDDSDGESVGSALSSELGETVDSTSILNMNESSNLPTSSPILADTLSIGSQGKPGSPKRARAFPILPDLPPPRPISLVKPKSLLSAALNAQKKTPKNPTQAFASLSGKGSPNPLWIKIYAPFSKNADEPFEMPLDRVSKDGNPVIVAEAIGLSLWRYTEEKLEPPLEHTQLNVNKWVLRMVEDGEVDYDFPALGRTRPIADFTSNNNRGARGRSREKPFDEFALVQASSQQFEANNKETPQYMPALEEETVPVSQAEAGTIRHPLESRTLTSRSNVLLAGQPFATALSNTTVTPADRPTPNTTQATPRMGPTKTIRVRYVDIDMSARTTTLELTTDSYIAEILDHVVKRWNFEKGSFVLKVAGTNTICPLDRTVEALGKRSDLELVRRRFGAGPANMTGSPSGGLSPNAPLLLDIQGPKKGKKGQISLQALAQKQDLLPSASNFKKYYVIRKQLTSLQGSQRVLVFDGDFIHVMPVDTNKSDAAAKTSSIAFADIIRCKVSTKHSKLVRLVVRRATESKRYDFEARTAGEAQEIVDDVCREMRLAKG